MKQAKAKRSSVVMAASSDIMDGKPTLTYFPVYGRGEPARMAMWKAGIEFDEN